MDDPELKKYRTYHFMICSNPTYRALCFICNIYINLSKDYFADLCINCIQLYCRDCIKIKTYSFMDLNSYVKRHLCHLCFNENIVQKTYLKLLPNDILRLVLLDYDINIYTLQGYFLHEIERNKSENNSYNSDVFHNA